MEPETSTKFKETLQLTMTVFLTSHTQIVKTQIQKRQSDISLQYIKTMKVQKFEKEMRNSEIGKII